MRISIPIEQDNIILGHTNVTDDTAFFDNTYAPDGLTFPLKQQFQFDGSIYENTGGTYSASTYTASPIEPYNIGDIVIRDDGGIDYVQRISATSGFIHKQPSDYLSKDAHWDFTAWTEAWSIAREIPSWHTDDLSVGTYTVDGKSNITHTVEFSADGLRMYEKTAYDQYIRQFSLSSPFDISSKSVIDETWLCSDIQTLRFMFSSNGLYLYTQSFYTGLIRRYTLSTPWDIGSAPLWSNHDTSQYLDTTAGCGMEWNSDGTKFYLTDPDTATLLQYNIIGTPWSIAPANVTLTATISLTDIDIGMTNTRSLGFDPTDGTTLYIMGIDTSKLHKLKLGTAWDISSSIKYVGNMEIFNGATHFTWNKSVSFDGAAVGQQLFITKAFLYKVTRFTSPTPYDILTTYPTVFPIRYTPADTNDVKYYIYKKDDGSYGNSATYEDDSKTNATLSTYMTIDNDSNIVDAIIRTHEDGIEAILGRTMVINEDAIYIRTHIANTLEYDTITDYQTNIVLTPADLKNFSLLGRTNPLKPFDLKNYTKAEACSEMQYILTSTSKFDTLALGKVKADRVYLEFRNVSGDIITTKDIEINSSRDTLNNLEDTGTTVIYYSDKVLDEGSSVSMTLYGCELELGTLLLGMSADAGFTNLAIKNSYKDFSVFEYDTWGNADYTERAKVSSYSGSVDIPITNYDMTDRLMTSLGKNLVIINGSDESSCGCNSLSIFSATQKIGRFLSFNQNTTIKDGDMDVMANYTFTLEEIVSLAFTIFAFSIGSAYDVIHFV